MIWLIVLIVLIPTIELWGLLVIGGWIGALPTVLIVIATGILGGLLAKREGIQALRLAQIQMQNQEMPSEAILDGICVIIGAIFLLTPGFFTDFIGLFFLIPYTRAIAKMGIKHWVMRKK